ncbi:MAG: cysteine hydrolase [Egibacteraceae bacterium]
MNLAKAALVVIDMQNGFVNDRSRHIIPIVVNLVAWWERAGGDILFTRYLNYPGSQYERLMQWSALQGSPEIDIVDELGPYARRARAIIDKTVYTMFTCEGRSIVRDGGWTELVFCGIATESCVLKSAVDAFELGYTPWVVHDASASHDGEATHQAGLLVTGRFIGASQLIDTATLTAKLLPASA